MVPLAPATHGSELQVTFRQMRAVRRKMNHFLGAVVVTIAMVSMASATAAGHQKYPDVVDVKVQVRGDNRFDFDVTVSSPYDTPQRYADAFRVKNADGQSYGERELVHDHQHEQPFTRDLYGVSIPTGVRTVIIQARDQKYGYGGKTMEIVLPGR
jgi:hypothetical protein